MDCICQDPLDQYNNYSGVWWGGGVEVVVGNN